MAEFSDKSTLSKFDIIKFAKNILSEVENVRAFESLVDEDTADNFKVPNESRVNAFFRLVGLPMFVAIEDKSKSEKKGKDATGLRHMSPGYSAERVNLLSYKLKNAEKIGDDEIAKLLTDRESNLQKIENSIGNDETNKAMALSLTIPMPLTPNIPDKNNKLDGYLGSGENKRTVYKKLFPLITSYREILPKANEVAVPFTLKENRKIDSTTELQRPFIETVARIRLVTADNAGSTKENNREASQLLALSGRLATDDYEKVSQDFAALKAADILELYILNKLFISLEQLANKWVEIKKKQQLAAKQDVFNISIKTTSAKRNPLGKRIDVSADLTLRKETSDTGNRLAWLRKKEAEEEAFLSLLPSDDTVDADGTSPKTSITSNTALGALINEFTDLMSSNLTMIKKEIQREEARIKKNIQMVEELRLEIDMMTGEFSGLSVLDVVAVIAGLFLIEKKDLLALLDKETIDVMKTDDTLKGAVESLGVTISASTAYTAVQNLEKAISGVFKVLNLYVKTLENKDKRTARRGKRKTQKQQKTEPSLSGRTPQATSSSSS